MKSRQFSLLLAFCGLVLPISAFADYGIAGSKSREQQQELVQAEDHFYARFNALNIHRYAGAETPVPHSIHGR